jgi:hypothetical protein
VSALMARPPEGKEFLIFDRTRRLAIYRPAGDPVVTLTDLRPSGPSFTPDGRYFLYLIPDPPPPPPAVTTLVTGQLFAQDADNWDLPPRRLSPEGASVPIEPQKGYLVRSGRPYPLVFWARFGLGASDLYLGDHETGVSVRVAQGIGEVSVSQTHVLGVVNMSQDLTGQLTVRDFTANKERVVENGVADYELDGDLFDGDLVAFTVRERMASSRRNGLWSTTLPTLDEPPAARVVGAQALIDGAGDRGLNHLEQWDQAESADAPRGEGSGGAGRGRGDFPQPSPPARDR